jgi:hypothetical protein
LLTGVFALAVAVLASCSGATQASAVHITESDVSPLEDLADTAILSMKVSSEKNARVVGVRFDADAGLIVKYEGITYCRPSCVAGGRFSHGLDTPAESDSAVMARSIDGRLPFELLSDATLERVRKPILRIVFTMRLNDAGRAAILKRCLVVRAVLLTLRGGSVVRALGAREDGLVAGLHAPDPLPSGYVECRA